MQITLTHLNLQDPRPVLQGMAIGYPCEFTSFIGGGPALLAPRRRLEELSPGRSLSVEMVPGAVGELLILPAQQDSPARLEPLLDSPGDFLAAGVVTSLVWLDDELEDAMLEVMVGPALFSFPAGQAGEGELDWGGWVQFRIQGLVLREQVEEKKED